MSATPQTSVPDFPTREECCLCGAKVEADYCSICDKCETKLGSHLAKMLVDPFDYAIGLKSGVVLRIVCKDVTLKGQWLEIPQPDEVHGLPYPFCRGMQIHISQIAWVSDAPEGS